MNTWIGAIAAVLALAASPVLAATITFDQALDSGTLTYNGTGGPLVGTGIGFQTITPSATDPPPFNAGTSLGCGGCMLNFTTGNNISEGPALWTFAGGGTFTLTGTIPALGIVVPTVILEGTFTGNPLAFSAGGSLTFGGGGIDMKVPELALFYWGIVAPPPPNDQIFMFSNTEITAVPTFTGNGGFSAVITEADISNRVPEPASGLLLLLGLGSLAAYRRARS
jgi:hypothetical protein